MPPQQSLSGNQPDPHPAGYCSHASERDRCHDQAVSAWGISPAGWRAPVRAGMVAGAATASGVAGTAAAPAWAWCPARACHGPGARQKTLGARACACCMLVR